MQTGAVSEGARLRWWWHVENGSWARQAAVAAAEAGGWRAHEPFSTCYHHLRRPPSLSAPVFTKSHFTQPKKAIYSAKTDLLSQRKPLYAYDMTFLCPRISLFLYFMFHKLWREHTRFPKGDGFLIAKPIFAANFTLTWKLPYNRALLWKLISLHQKSLK